MAIVHYENDKKMHVFLILPNILTKENKTVLTTENHGAIF